MSIDYRIFTDQIRRGLLHGVLLVLLAILSCVVHALDGDTCKSVVVSADPEFPPFAWYDGKQLHGASVNVVTEVLDAMRLPYEVRYVGPFLRLLQSAEFGTVDIIAELKDTPGRREFLQFVPTPIFPNPTSVFVKSTSGLRYRSREDLKGHSGGVTHGTRFGGGFDEYLSAELSIESAPGIKENFGKLAAERIEYFVSPYYPAMSYLAPAGKEAEFVALKPNVAQVDNFVGWSKKSLCLSRLAEFDAVLAKRVRSGVTQQRIDEAMKAWRRAPTMSR
ncbi:MAG: amino acid-binding protein [Rhodocyclales bacterium]|nr:amino acid-binding protein [Rhodocyclales bacterium]